MANDLNVMSGGPSVSSTRSAMHWLWVAGLAVGFVTVVGNWIWLRAAPAVGVLTASPSYVLVNVAREVTFSVAISDPTVIPTGVNLIEADKTGKTIGLLGQLRDDGTNGDSVANDKTFTVRTSLESAIPLDRYFLASAAFKGTLRRTLSGLVRVSFARDPLPPDPAEAGKQTLEGIDRDADGIRDDVQRYIAESAPNSGDLRAALTQLTRPYQDFISNGDADLKTIQGIAARSDQAQDCLTFVAGNPTESLRLLRELRARILNTKARSLAFVKADNRLSGYFVPPTDPATFAASCR